MARPASASASTTSVRNRLRGQIRRTGESTGLTAGNDAGIWELERCRWHRGWHGVVTHLHRWVTDDTIFSDNNLNEGLPSSSPTPCRPNSMKGMMTRQAGVRTLQDEAPQTSASGERREGGLREEACKNQPDFERRASRHCFAKGVVHRDVLLHLSCNVSARGRLIVNGKGPGLEV